ncbi:hypothetical protein [Frigidibacter oleivorans]|nr:hypothetical protein [Frigidibacter oleivorans]
MTGTGTASGSDQFSGWWIAPMALLGLGVWLNLAQLAHGVI